MISAILFLLKRMKGYILQLLFLSFLIPIFSVVISPIAIEILINKGLSGSNLTVIIYSIITLLLSNIFSVMLNYYLNIKKQDVANHLLKQFVPQELEKYYMLNYSDIMAKGEGYYLSRIYDEPKEIAERFVPIIINTFSNCHTLIFGLVVAGYIAWEVTVVLVVVSPFIYWLGRRYNWKIKKAVNRENDVEGTLRNLITKSLQAFSTVLFYDMGNKTKEMVTFELSSFTKAASNLNKQMSLFTMFNSLFFTGSRVLVLILVSIAVFVGRVTIGGMMGFLNVYGRILVSVNNLSGSVPNFSKGQVSKAV